MYTMAALASYSTVADGKRYHTKIARQSDGDTEESAFDGETKSGEVSEETMSGTLDTQDPDEKTELGSFLEENKEAVNKTRRKTGKGLLIIDVQKCFLPGGTLAVEANHIIPVINKIREKDCLFDLVVKSQDFHPPGHVSFASSNLIPDHPVGFPIPMRCWRTPGSRDMAEGSAACCPNPFSPKVSDAAEASKVTVEAMKGKLSEAAMQMQSQGNVACRKCIFGNMENCFDMHQAMWPDHCLDPSKGKGLPYDADFPSSLVAKATDVIVKKGTNKWVDAYSAFMDNTQTLMTELHQTFQDAGVNEIYVVGIATDFCVAYSAKDAKAHLPGFSYNTTVVQDASAGIGIPMTEGPFAGKTTIDLAYEEMRDMDINIMDSQTLLDMPCPSA